MDTQRGTCLKGKNTDACGDDQLRKFKKTAKELGCTDNEAAFENSFAKIVKPVKPKKKSPQKSK